MNQKKYLDELKGHLATLSKNEIDEIIADQEEYFREAISKGKSVEQIISELGNPAKFASQILANNYVNRVTKDQNISSSVGNIIKSILAFIVVAPINFIIFAGPLFVFSLLIFLGWIGSTVSGLLSFVLVFLFLFKFIFASFAVLIHISAGFFILSWVCMTIFSFLLMYFITKYFLIAIAAIIKWNLTFMKSAQNM